MRRAFNCSCGLSVVFTGSAAALVEHGPKLDAIVTHHTQLGHEAVSAFKAAGIRRRLGLIRDKGAA